MLKSMSLKEFIQTLESYLKKQSLSETQFVEQFMTVIQEEKLTVSYDENVEAVLVFGQGYAGLRRPRNGTLRKTLERTKEGRRREKVTRDKSLTSGFNK